MIRALVQAIAERRCPVSLPVDWVKLGRALGAAEAEGYIRVDHGCFDDWGGWSVTPKGKAFLVNARSVDVSLPVNHYAQTQALHLTVREATRLLARVHKSRFLRAHGCEVYTVDAPSIDVNGVPVASVYVMVRAPSDLDAGAGKGFLVALSEGIEP